MCLLYMDNGKNLFYELSSWCYRPAKLAYGPLGTARDSFCFLSGQTSRRAEFYETDNAK